MEEYHEPVLLREAVEALKVKAGNWYADATLGDGGHSLEIIKKGGLILGIDQNPQALDRVKKRFTILRIDNQSFKLVRANFADIGQVAKQTMGEEVRFSGILFDLGVSSLELEDTKRGFSFLTDASLDMRMDPALGVTAADLVNGLNVGELEELFTKLGEEKLAKRIAVEIVRVRSLEKIERTRQLAGLIEGIYRNLKIKREKIHPATRVFQALRIAVNDELNNLKLGLSESLGLIKDEGRVVVISFHSLEDRIVKNIFKDWETAGWGSLVVKKPVVPTEEEVSLNPRSRSAKMRVFEKI